MFRDIFMAFIGASIALLLKAAYDIWVKYRNRKKLVVLCLEHLKMIREDLSNL